jgi:hypothetical protein
MHTQGHRVVIGELRIVPTGKATPPGGIDHAIARRVPYGSFGPFVQAQSAFARAGYIGGLREHFDATIGAVLKVPVVRPRRRREAGRDDRFYALLARDYLASIVAGSRTPIKDLAAARKQPPSRVRDMVREARERGLLTMSNAGKLGGQLTPAAEALLSPRKGGKAR